uniref:Uncharacterized protein n=1 Tax=Panagrolaimus sp. PS1159 TaxID=55785 RepID=A0AC35FL31_9BILA
MREKRERRRDSNNTVNSVTYNHLINGNAENSEVLKKYEEQRRQIQEALNKATYHQFLAYAQQTHPGDPEKVSFCLCYAWVYLQKSWDPPCYLLVILHFFHTSNFIAVL